MMITMPKKITKEKYLTYLEKCNPNIKLVGSFNGYMKKCGFHCDICGNDWIGTPRDYGQKNAEAVGIHGCPNCDRIAKKTRQLVPKEKVQEKINQTFDHNLVLLDYSGKMNGSGKFKCNTCGKEFESKSISGMLYEAVGNGCQYCNKESQYEKSRTHYEDVATYIRNQHLPFELLRYDAFSRYATLRCNNCGSEYRKNYRTGEPRLGTTGCPYCSTDVSTGEQVMLHILKYNRLYYHWRHLFYNELYHDQYQHLDFYLPELNIAFEVQGEQHYNPRSGFYNDVMPKLDNIKAQWCKKHNIMLYYIYPSRPIFPQVSKLIPLDRPPEDFIPVEDKRIHEVIDYLKSGHNLLETGSKFGLGVKVINRYIKVSGYYNYQDLYQTSRLNTLGLTNESIIEWLKHHHFSHIEDGLGITKKYVIIHIFNNDDYPYNNATDIKVSAISSDEFGDYRKNHNRRDTARYFLTDSKTITRILGTKDW